MGRKILAVVVAMIAAGGVIMIVQMLNSIVVPPPTSDITGDPAKFREFMANLPTMAFVIVLISYILGSFTGGFIATKMGRRWSSGPTLALIVGVILTIGGILNFFVALPGQPMWFVAASMVSYIPFSLLGYRFAR
ncbi:MAG: hypothetical protein ACKVRN_10625 [Pyrinomonadaceae bacterium]